MKNSKFWAFLNSVGVFFYILFVAYIMQNGEKIFGRMTNILGPVAFLLLFVLSAAIVGALILGRPIMMYLDGQKKEAVRMFIYTVVWIFIILTAALVTQIVV